MLKFVCGFSTKFLNGKIRFGNFEVDAFNDLRSLEYEKVYQDGRTVYEASFSDIVSTPTEQEIADNYFPCCYHHTP